LSWHISQLSVSATSHVLILHLHTPQIYQRWMYFLPTLFYVILSVICTARTTFVQADITVHVTSHVPNFQTSISIPCTSPRDGCTSSPPYSMSFYQSYAQQKQPLSRHISQLSVSATSHIPILHLHTSQIYQRWMYFLPTLFHVVLSVICTARTTFVQADITVSATFHVPNFQTSISTPCTSPRDGCTSSPPYSMSSYQSYA